MAGGQAGSARNGEGPTGPRRSYAHVKRVPHPPPPFGEPDEPAEAAKLESFLPVLFDSQEGQAMAASASLEGRSSSKVRPQASHRYS